MGFKITTGQIKTALLAMVVAMAFCSSTLMARSGGTATPQTTLPAPDKKWDDSPIIWEMLRDEFRIAFNPNRKEIRKQIQWFQHNQHYLYQILERAGPLISYIHQKTQQRHLPAELVLIPFIESEYNTTANSHAGAGGLWQFMPQTATNFGLKQNWWYDDRFDVIRATHSALDYLAYLNTFFSGNWLHAIAAYDSGEGTVQHAINRNKQRHKTTQFWRLKLPHETQSYIPKLLALVSIIREPEYYGVTLPNIHMRPYFQPIQVPAHLPITAIAGLAETDMEELLALNPAFKQTTTGPRQQTTVLLPIEKAALFQSNLALNPGIFKHTWLYHSVIIGDTLTKIARQHKTTVAMLKKVNHLDSARIVCKQKLLVPNAELNIASMDVRYSYIIQHGDTLSTIAKKYQTTVAKLKQKNDLSDDIIRPGRILMIR